MRQNNAINVNVERSILMEKFLRCWECLHFCYCKNYLKIFVRSEFNEKIFFVYLILRFWCKTYLEGKFQDKLKNVFTFLIHYEKKHHVHVESQKVSLLFFENIFIHDCLTFNVRKWESKDVYYVSYKKKKCSLNSSLITIFN